MSGSTRELLDACVHCGFCLPACPTYTLWGEEMDSPRGRIHLMSLVEDGELALDASVARHLDRCLGCLACVPACPSGVRYDRLIERARVRRRAEAPTSLRGRLIDRAVFALFPRPRLLRAVSWPLALGIRPLALAPRVSLGDMRAAPPSSTPAVGELRMSVALLSGCVQRVYFGRVNVAAAGRLSACGCDVAVPGGQGCCGALHLHAGREQQGRRLAERTIAALDGHDRVVATAAGCGSAMKEYGELLGTERAREFSSRVRDISELLAELPPPPVAGHEQRSGLRVVYQDACHLNHAQGVHDQPRELLRAVPGLELVEIADADLCCGSAGIYNLTQPRAAAQLGDRKARAILDAEPDVIATGNPGCALQLAAALRRLGRGDLPIVHPVQLLG
ncbi:MAG: glycolate oxidase iron-sulfur subunit [Gaiellales bacterium]|jgi:glycolate oxidase iron-sulfur subunit|nr:glycolate oxidase iron-sulfur subunit [Gaiellales bacterium]